MIRVLVNGSSGKMGRAIVTAIKLDNEIQLAGEANSKDNLSDIIKQTKPDIVVDFTTPHTAFRNAETIASCKCNGIIGTTGITSDQRTALHEIALKNGRGILIAPNFCIGAVVMMKLAAEAAKYLPNVEIIEYHHDHKADAPSGTAITTAEYINDANVNKINAPAVQSSELLNDRSQGAKIGNIRIHAVRLPGFIASQEVILGGEGQTLTIRHDTINRESFIPGIIYAVKNIIDKKGLIYGLEKLLFQGEK
ncbi:MAG TPA: 4-hydroxy-tetrahydrodipicolinate reductase [Chitinispirillaceae bacterium]|nr:4-hydroxy-tetrahydrodipicolinate reductase [Chitinispirillaceae bacterium]